MSTSKPNLTRTWAAGAPANNVVDPDTTTPGKFDAGWLAEVPPFEHFNFLQKLFTQGLAHNNEQGINIWDIDTTYPLDGLTKGSNGVTYIAIVEQSGNDPVSDGGTNWEVWNNSVGDKSHRHVFPTVAAYKAFTKEFPVGKVISLLDRQADFIVIAGTGTATGFGIIASDEVSQSIEISPSEIINVRTYGALDDGGATDSQPAIWAALIDGSIDLDGGHYGFKNPIDLDISDREIIGNGATLSYTADYEHTRGGVPLEQLYFFNIGTQGDRPLPQTDVDVDNVTMSGITFDGTQPASILDSDTIYKSVTVEVASGATNITIKHCTILRPRSHSPSRGAIFARSGSSNVRMLYCNSINPDGLAGEGGGGMVASGKNCKVIGCYMENLRDSAIGFDGAIDCTASLNTIVLNTVDGGGSLVDVGNSMQLTDGSVNCVVTDNTFLGFNVGLEVNQIGGVPVDVHHNVISDNIFDGGSYVSTGAASLAIRLGLIARDNTIDGNIIHGMSNKGNGSACIQLYPNNNKVTNNKVTDLDADGNREVGSLVDGINVRFDSNPKTNVTVVGNEISVGRRGVHLSSGNYLDTKHLIIEDNTIIADTADGLNLGLEGISISNTGSKYIRLNNNDFVGVFSSDWAGTWDYIAYFQSTHLSHKRPRTSVGYENKVLWRNVMPTSKSWVAGDIVLNTTKTVDGNNMVLDHWLRITTGSGNVLNTDWVAVYLSTASPAN